MTDVDPMTCSKSLKLTAALQPTRSAYQSWLEDPLSRRTRFFGDAENARPENDGQRKLWVWKMQDWKMTDKLLANCEHSYGVWKMQDWKMTDKLLANCEHNYVCF